MARPDNLSADAKGYYDSDLGSMVMDIPLGAMINLANKTTAERDALTASNGMMIYNSSDDEIQVYKAGAWVNITTS